MRRLLTSLQILGLVACVAIFVVTSLRAAKTLSVAAIEVVGGDIASQSIRDEVGALVADTVGFPLATVGLGELVRQAESHPWVKSARAWRVFPNLLRVAIEPRRAIAAIQTERGIEVLTDTRERLVSQAGVLSVPVVLLPKAGSEAQVSRFVASWRELASDVVLEQVAVGSSPEQVWRVVARKGGERLIVTFDPAQGTTWLPRLSRLFAVLSERHIAARHVVVLDHKKFVVKTS